MSRNAHDTIATLVPQMAVQALASYGTRVCPVTTDASLAGEFTRALPAYHPAGATVTFPYEWIVPSCAEVSLDEMLVLRDTVGTSYRAHTSRLMDSMISLSSRPDWSRFSPDYSPDEISESAAALRRLARTGRWGGRGYVGFG